MIHPPIRITQTQTASPTLLTILLTSTSTSTPTPSPDIFVMRIAFTSLPVSFLLAGPKIPKPHVFSL